MKLFTIMILLSSLLVTMNISTNVALANNENVKKSAIIYFMPFEVQTFGQISKDDIERNSHFSFAFYGENPFCGWLIAQLQRSKEVEKIDNFTIRLKFEDTEHMKTYFIDQGGVVERSDGATFRLSKSQMKNIQEKLESFVGIVDLKVQNKE